MTPQWAAKELVAHFLPNLGLFDFVLEPSCGVGNMLKAIPSTVPALGIELDPELAAHAERNTGRQILVGDFRTIEIPFKPTVILGNPPYRVKLFDEFLVRACQLLPDGGRCGFLLSTHMLQTPLTVLRWNKNWSLESRIVPRTLFPRSIRPLTFVTFTKDKLQRMHGFLLYNQCSDVAGMTVKARVLLATGVANPGVNCWRALVEWALQKLGGQAALPDIYRVIDPHRPVTNNWWQHKVRQILQIHFRSVRRGVWALA